MSGITIHLEGLEDHIEQVVEEKLVAALDTRSDDPWLGSAAAAEYLVVSRQRVHDLVNEGRLPRHGEPGTKLYFRRSELDAFAEGRR